MKLGALYPAAPPSAADLRVSGFALDHRKVAPGTVFGAFVGTRFNGEDFIAAAIAIMWQGRKPIKGQVVAASPETRKPGRRRAS